MTAVDLAELERLLAEYQTAMSRANFIAKGKTRKPLETALVRHANDLIQLARETCDGRTIPDRGAEKGPALDH